MKSRGCTSVFTENETEELKHCIADLAELGFAPTLMDIREIVRDYVELNNHEKGKQVLQFKGIKGCPGQDWMRLFLQRNNLSLKTATKICTKI